MTMTETLFGGLIAVVLMFMIGRRVGLSSYWSGILGGVLPFLTYLVLSMDQWPGADVLAIHLVVFLATAALLGVFSNTQKSRVKMHWAPKLIIGFFVLLALINAALLSIATHGLPEVIAKWVLPNHGSQRLHTGFSGAIPHDRNKLYEAHQQRMETQKNLGWQVHVRGLEQLRSGVSAPIDVTVRDARQSSLAADRVSIEFWRVANRKDDIVLELDRMAVGEYQTTVTLPATGRWIAVLNVGRESDIHQTQYPLQVDAP